jgi:hypothetical protein
MDTIIAPLIRDLSNLVALSARRFSPQGDGKPPAQRRVEAQCLRAESSKHVAGEVFADCWGSRAAEWWSLHRRSCRNVAERQV